MDSSEACPAGSSFPAFFSFEPDEWPAWRTQFERSLRQSKLAQGSEERKITALLLFMGEKADDVCQSLKLTSEESKCYAKVVDKLDDYFVELATNAFYERIIFNLRGQEENENLDQYLTTLHEMSEKCDYGAMREDQVRDRFAAGLQDKQLRTLLSGMRNPTLAMVLDKAREWEAVKLCEMVQDELLPCTHNVPAATDDKVEAIVEPKSQGKDWQTHQELSAVKTTPSSRVRVSMGKHDTQSRDSHSSEGLSGKSSRAINNKMQAVKSQRQADSPKNISHDKETLSKVEHQKLDNAAGNKNRYCNGMEHVFSVWKNNEQCPAWCRKCGREGHRSRDIDHCPARTARCRNCGDIGHYEKQCCGDDYERRWNLWKGRRRDHKDEENLEQSDRDGRREWRRTRAVRGTRRSHGRSHKEGEDGGHGGSDRKRLKTEDSGLKPRVAAGQVTLEVEIENVSSVVLEG